MKSAHVLLLFMVLCLLTACLTYEKRIYSYRIHADGTVDLTIQYLDIRSSYALSETTIDTGFVENEIPAYQSQTAADYNTLIEDYYVSNYFAACYPRGKVISKILYSENGTLNGKVIVHFPDPESAGIYRIRNKRVLYADSICGYSFYLDSTYTSAKWIQYTDSTGNEGPVLRYMMTWPRKACELNVVTFPPERINYAVSLLKEWEKDK